MPCIVVGNRSSVYAPVHAPGLVAIWDDGDPLLAEPLSPGVHARDAALIRQELDGCAVVFAGHTRTTDVERLVALGWVRDVSAARRASPRVVLSATKEGESRGARVPSAAFAAAREALADRPGARAGRRARATRRSSCAPTAARRRAACTAADRCTPHDAGAVPGVRLVRSPAHTWACPKCTSMRVRMASSGSERTADELGRAFPGIRIIVADGEHPVLHVDARPALVVATRGAEPIAEGGYRAVILLDGDRMLLADDLRIGESCLRWWSNAAALAAPGAPVHLVGVTGSGRARTRHVDPARLRPRRARRSGAAAHAADRARRRARGQPRRRRDGADRTLRADVPVARRRGDPRARVAAMRVRVRSCASTTRTGTRVAESLRGSIVADALRARKNAKTRAPQAPRTYTQSAGRRARPRPVRNAMRLVFAGTPDAAVPSLRALAASDHDIVAVVTRRDAPIGRKRVLTPSPVAAAADELGIPTIKTDRLDAAATRSGDRRWRPTSA